MADLLAAGICSAGHTIERLDQVVRRRNGELACAQCLKDANAEEQTVWGRRHHGS